jgi:hypothetical protein
VIISYTVGKPVNTFLTASTLRPRVGLPMVFSDLVCPTGSSTTRPTGTVTFTDATTHTTLGMGRLFIPVGNCAAAGLVTAFRTPGTHVVTAVYSGDSNYLGNSTNPEMITLTVSS